MTFSGLLLPFFGHKGYEALTKREVKLAGYRPTSIFALLCTEVNKNAKKNEANIHPS